jgi:hypothetical protein
MTARDLKANIQALSLELSDKDVEIHKLLSSLTRCRQESHLPRQANLQEVEALHYGTRRVEGM